MEESRRRVVIRALAKERTHHDPPTVALAALLALAPALATAESKILAGILDCPAPDGSAEHTLAIELDENLPLAVVNDEERPAYYETSHILILLDRDGPALTIGRSSGRIVAFTPGGESVALGTCSARTRV